MWFCLQLHRLTWWSRNSQEPRIDLAAAPTTPDPAGSDPVGSDPGADPDHSPAPWWKRAALRFCGLVGPDAGSPSPVPEGNKLNSLEEAPLWRAVCNANALILLSVNVFCWGYFA